MVMEICYRPNRYDRPCYDLAVGFLSLLCTTNRMAVVRPIRGHREWGQDRSVPDGVQRCRHKDNNRYDGIIDNLDIAQQEC